MKHPPKPFTPEWCELHPGQGQCPDDITSVPIDNAWFVILLTTAILIYLLKTKKLRLWIRN